jgi:FixJ family two-component response regulator
MTNKEEQRIFFVDDQADVCKAVSSTLEEKGFKVSYFSSGTDCLIQLRSQKCDLLITDLKMPDMNGLELLIRVKRLIPSLPVLVITGYGNIPMAVKAMRQGALDFLEKPLDTKALSSAVEFALSQSPQAHRLVARVLSKSEMIVLRLLLNGKSTKEIARLQHRSVRTIEDHRYDIMHKLGANNMVDLVKQVAVVKLPDVWEE